MTPGQRFKASFFKSLPIAAGVLFGLLVVRPPAFLQALGWPLYAIAGFLLVVFLVGLVVMLVAANLPSKLELREREGSLLPGAVGSLVSNLRALGFVDVGPPRELATTPPAMLIAFTHKDHPIYATIFQPGHRATAPTFEMWSVLAGGRGSLTTFTTVGALTAPRTALRQIFPKAEPSEAFAKHKKALSALRARGISARAVSASTFEDDYRAAFFQLRGEFFRRPIRNAFVTLWRSLSGKSAELGLVTERPHAAAAIDELASS